ncbi:MAG: hypothetical protein PUB19_04330 [Lachnospiraceae bacterium]|nr:hypothetical protein [Lachnospiraceae bacterium]
MREIFKKRMISLGLAGCLIFGLTASVFTTNVQAAGIVVDGDLSEWSHIAKQPSMDGSVTYWSVAQDEEYLYFCGHDIYGTDWYRPLAQQTVIFSYANNGATGANGYKQQVGLKVDGDRITVRDYWYNNVAGAGAVYRHTAGTSNEANMERDYEWSLPKSFLADTEGSLKFCGTEIRFQDIPQANTIVEPVEPENPEQPQEPETKPSYQGIVIDGKFADWDAIQKTPINDNKDYNTVDETAMVWDGDTIYLYFMAKGNGDGTGNWNSVTQAGPYNSGQFVIKTDLGRELLIQLSDKDGGSVKGVEGAKVAVNNKKWEGAPFMWEVSIPASALPPYKSTISFGIYQGDMVISDVANLQGSGAEEDQEFQGIVIDGLYGDWEFYPHTPIQYATQGTEGPKVDGEGALYAEGGKLYAHVNTQMGAHLSEGGGEFTEGVSIRLNKDKYFYPEVIAVDAQGNITYNPHRKDLPRGTYEFYLIDRDGWKTAKNISELEQCHNGLYGHMFVTVGASADDMEFEMDLELVAKKFGMDASDIKTIEGQWIRIGEKWIATAGTSTGTWAGLLICFAGVGGAALIQRKRRKHA